MCRFESAPESRLGGFSVASAVALRSANPVTWMGRLDVVLDAGAHRWLCSRSFSSSSQPLAQYVTSAVSVDGVGLIIGLGPTIIPPSRKPDIIQLRKRLRRGGTPITDDTLYDKRGAGESLFTLPVP